MSQPPAKRKRTEDDNPTSCDNRVFKEEWTHEFFFVEHNGEPLCLICGKSLSSKCFKRGNLSRHYEKEHLKKKHPDSLLTGQLRKNKIDKLKRNLQVQSSMFTAKGNELERSIQAGYAICDLMATHLKPFSEGEFVKKILNIAAYYCIPENPTVFSNISLSRRTCTRVIGDLTQDVKEQVVNHCENFKYYSICVDESTDVKDTAQLAVFIRGVNNSFEIGLKYQRFATRKN